MKLQEAKEILNLTAEEEDMIKLYGLNFSQIKWRRWCIANNCGGDVELFKQEYP